jgi:hypothetical protein
VDESLLSKVVGERLAAVVFVGDYLQLDFNDARFTAYAWPHVRIGASTWAFGDRGYRDSLCAFISHEVVEAEESSAVGLLFRFGLGDVVTNPELTELSGPEIAMLSVYDPMWQTTELEVWRPGEDTFAGLN